MEKNIKKISLLIGISFLVSGFQNCTKVGFTSGAVQAVAHHSPSSTPPADIGGTPDSDPGLDADVPGNDSSGVDSLVPDTEPADSPDEIKEEQADNDDDKIDDMIDESDDDAADQADFQEVIQEPGIIEDEGDLANSCTIEEAAPVEDISVANTGWQRYRHIVGPLHIPEVEKLSIFNVDGDVTVDSADFIFRIKHVLGFVSARANTTRRIKNIRDGVDLTSGRFLKISKVDGNVRAHANEFSTVKRIGSSVCILANKGLRVRHIRGNVRVVGFELDSKSATLRNIKNIRGSVYLTNVKVKTVKNVHGDIFLNNSTVKRFRNIHGSIVNLN